MVDSSVAAERRGRVHRAARLVRVPGELRPAHRAGHDRDSGRRRGADLAGRDALLRGTSRVGGPGCLPRLGHRQQPTRKVSLTDATWLAAIKGLVAGPVNLILAFSLGAVLPPAPNIAGAMAVGLVAYGISLTLFIVALRHIGTARAGACYSVAPFFGALLAVALGDVLTGPLVVAGLLMALGVVLHLTEHHSHPHTHEATTHDHWHTHTT